LPKNIVSEIGVALIISLVIVVDCISMASLVFSGRLSEYLPTGIGIFLASSVIIGAVVGWTSSFRGNIAHPKSIAGAIFALIAASAATSLSGTELISTIVFAIAFTTFLTGLFFYVVGRLQLGKLTRFIPYPVIGGFLAGMGWLIVDGSISVLTGESISPESIPRLLQRDALLQLVPGALFAVALLVLQRRYKNVLLVPGMVLLFLGSFYGLLWLTGSSMGEAFDKGWLIGPFPGGMLWEPLSISTLASVNWAFLSGEVGNIVAVVLLCTLAVLLNYTGLELITDHEFDLNNELRSTGAANVFASLAGGSVGFNSPVFCILSHTAGLASRVTAVIMPAVCAVSLLFGASLFAYLPRALVGGFLMSLGLDLLARWMVDARRQLSGLDYALVTVILVLIATWGFLQGFVVGVWFAIIIFIVNYSRIEVVKHALSGVSFRSNVERSPAKQGILAEHGELVFILRLQGYLFFGTANNIFTRVKDRMGDADLPAPGYLLLDFAAVTGIDSSAIVSFDKINRLAQQHQARVVLSGLSHKVEKLLRKSGILGEGKEMTVHSDLDRSMEWCEDRILSEHGAMATMVPVTTYLSDFLSTREEKDLFMDYMERIEVPAQQVLLRQGEAPYEMYFIEQGQVDVLIEPDGVDDAPPKRLRSVGAGALVGEMGIFSGSPRTATLVASKPSILYRLTVDSMNKMLEQQPKILTSFQRYIVRLLIKRLAYSNRMVTILSG
jgi:SulP family sulfate permease